MNILIASLLVFAGLGLAYAQIQPVCVPPPKEVETVFVNGTASTNRRGIREFKARVRKNNPWFGAIQEGAAASLINPADWVETAPRWLSVCSGKPFNITIPTWHIVDKRLCYTPKPFRDYTYPTVICPNVPCTGVRPTDPREYARCRPQNYKKYTICIWCLNKKGNKFVRVEYDIHTYRCCSCCRYRC